MDRYLRYRPDAAYSVIISGHRGGMAPGFPENCIESFENTLHHMPSFFEIDPRMTRDSVLVLMHDATIDRTTNGSGRVEEYTYEQLQQFNLVDRNGRVTPYKIPRVSDVIRWSRGKAILNFDEKQGEREALIRLVIQSGARNVIYTVHNAEEVRACLALDPNARFSAWVGSMEELEAYEATGVRWSRMIAYVVSDRMQAEQQQLYEALHKRGVRCMVSTAPSFDQLPAATDRSEAYGRVLAGKPDIVESDYPVEFVPVLEQNHIAIH